MKNIRIILSIPLAAALLAGCSEFLDTVPDERTQLDEVGKVEALLTSAYPQRSFAALVSFRCDNITDQGSTATGSQPTSLLSFAGDQFVWKELIEQGNDREEIFWTECYAAIAASNHALAALAKLPEEEGRAASGEAYMTRAFAHFYLVTLFCEWYNPANASLYPGIPYVDEPEETPIKMYDRSTVEETYRRIEEDLSKGMALMTDGTGFHAPKYHFNATSAAAFATRFFLMKGDYTNVVTYADRVFPTPSAFVDIKDASGETLRNADGTPVRNVDATDAAVTFAASNFHPYLTGYTNMGSAYAIMDEFVSSTNPGNLLLCEQTTSIGLTYFSYYSRFGMSQSDAFAVFTSDTGTGGDWIFPAIVYASDNIWFVPKFPYDLQKESVAATSGIPWSVMPLLRMEEVLLNRAEAYVMLGEYDKAIADMNVFLSQRVVPDVQTDRTYDPSTLYLSRDRALDATSYDRAASAFINAYNDTASWPELKKALIVLLLRYRNAEFSQEGLRWYDIRRWNIPVRHTLATGGSNTLAPGDGRRVLQIPESALLSGVEKNERTNIDDTWN